MNGCAAPKALLAGREELEAAHAAQLAKLTAEYPEFPEALELLRESMEVSVAWQEG